MNLYRILRYEDLVESMLDQIATTFHHFGLPTSSFDLQNSVANFTKPYKVQNRIVDPLRANEKWIYNVKSGKTPFEEILSVQEKCSHTMTTWGYKRVENSEDLYNERFGIFVDKFNVSR